jgi:hypothetical protein
LTPLAFGSFISRKQAADPVDQVVAGDRPGFAGIGRAEMMSHAGRARRKDREIGPALALHPKLAVADRIANLLVTDRRPPRRPRTFRMRLNLRLSPLLVLLGSSRVVTVAVDNHCAQPLLTIPGQASGIVESPDQARTYLKHEAGNSFDAAAAPRPFQ